MLVCSPHIFFGEILIRIICSFFVWLSVSLLLFGFESYLLILDTNPLSNIWLANIFSEYIISFHSLNIVFFSLPTPSQHCLLKRKNFILMKFNLSVFSFMDYDLGILSKNSLPKTNITKIFCIFS